ncbi:hypothetical protein JCM5350_004985 [Sporobolomyces pararoseus]
MTEDQSATSSANGKKARRGRRQDDTLPPSRSRDVQRAFRARRAAHLTHLESTVEWLQAENNALREKAGLPLDGPPLTGPAPVEEIIEGPAELPPTPAPAKKPGAGKASRKNSKMSIAEDNSDAESQKMDEDVPQDEARGAAKVLAGAGGGSGGGNTKQNGISLPPMNVPSSSTTSPIVPTSAPPNTSQPLSTYSLPQQSSPRAQNYHPHLPQHPYLVHGPHASASYPSHPVPAYSSQQYAHPYQQFPQNGGAPPYNAYYPQSQQFPQNGPPHSNMQGAFSMTLPPPNQNSQPYAPSLGSSQRNSISSAVPSPQTSTPPSSHMRASTIPTPAPLQHPHQPHIYTALVPNPASNFPSKTPSASFPLKPITNPSQQQQQQQQPVQDHQQQQQQQMMFNSIFPTPSPEDEQFFLDTFCGLANENMFLQSLYPNPEVYEIHPTTTVDSNEVVRNYHQEGRGGENRVDQIKEEDSNRVSSTRSSSPSLVVGSEKKEFDAQSYKNFCIGLMKGVKGIEGLIAQKRKRDRDFEDSQEGKKRKRLSDGRSQEERKEKEDEAVAFLTAMASSGAREKDRECCEGIIDCGPPTGQEKEKKKDDDDCCDGLIECGMTNKEKDHQKNEECCEGLISCDTKSSQPPLRPELIHSDSLPPPPSTIHLPRHSTTSSSSCCGPKTSCTLPPTSSPSESDAYILVSLAFTALSPYMSQSPDSPKLPPARIAELLFNDNRTISPSSPDSTAANLIIVPPTKEQEAIGKKGELYVRKEVVEAVKKWCEREMVR